RLMVAEWTGSMEHQIVRDIARIFLCPDLVTGDQYAKYIEEAGMRVISREQLASKVMATWQLHARHAQLLLRASWLVPERLRNFAKGIQLMQEAYRNGQLTYSLLIA